MSFEIAGRCKLSQFMTNHVFIHINWNEFVSIVHSKCVSYKFRHNCAATRPGFDYSLFCTSIHLVNFLLKVVVNVRTFFN